MEVYIGGGRDKIAKCNEKNTSFASARYTGQKMQSGFQFMLSSFEIVLSRISV